MSRTDGLTLNIGKLRFQKNVTNILINATWLYTEFNFPACRRHFTMQARKKIVSLQIYIKLDISIVADQTVM